MKEVIRIDQLEEERLKPVELTHFLNKDGWIKSVNRDNTHWDRIVFLGIDAGVEMFAAYDCTGTMLIYKGHLNSGKY